MKSLSSAAPLAPRVRRITTIGIHGVADKETPLNGMKKEATIHRGSRQIASSVGAPLAPRMKRNTSIAVHGVADKETPVPVTMKRRMKRRHWMEA